MKIKCRYCDSLIEDSEAICPQCGAPNADMKRAEEIEPKTIQELKDFCKRNNIPAEEMRFFIGADYKGARAFGIYQLGERFIVYKNKSDSSRAIRYDGKDEAYAVAQIYQKMKEEVAKRKTSPKTYHKSFDSVSEYRKPNKRRRLSLYPFFMVLTWVIVAVQLGYAFYTIADNTKKGLTRGYYEYEDTYYYRYDDNWYRYDDDLNDWFYQDDFQFDTSASPITYRDFYEEYGDNGYSSYDYDYYYGDTDTGYDSWSDNWDSDDDWDYDYSGWDSWDTDWDSDW